MESNKIIPQFIVNFLLSVSFAASFIGIFFFTYGKIVEKQIVVNNVNYTINDLSDFILDNPNISFWNHGHTHFPFDYMIGETRVLCNPRGYLPYEADNGFDVNFTFEV